jgi:hypothetical protein
LGFNAGAAISSSHLQQLQLEKDDDDGGELQAEVVCQNKLGKIKCSLQDGWTL